MSANQINDEQFGQLDWDQDMAGWQGETTLFQKQIELSIQTPDDNRTITDQARQALRVIANAEQTMLQCASDHLLDTFNKSWNEEDQPIDALTFQQRIKLTAITIYSDGSAGCYFEDDDLFAGHTIVVSMSSEQQFTEATIAG